eukprot:1298233-Pyramimonas_sp.AAC.1
MAGGCGWWAWMWMIAGCGRWMWMEALRVVGGKWRKGPMRNEPVPWRAERGRRGGRNQIRWSRGEPDERRSWGSESGEMASQTLGKRARKRGAGRAPSI